MKGSADVIVHFMNTETDRRQSGGRHLVAVDRPHQHAISYVTQLTITSQTIDLYAFAIVGYSLLCVTTTTTTTLYGQGTHIVGY